MKEFSSLDFIKPINKETWDLYGIQETWVWGLEKKCSQRLSLAGGITELCLTGWKRHWMEALRGFCNVHSAEWLLEEGPSGRKEALQTVLDSYPFPFTPPFSASLLQ